MNQLQVLGLLYGTPEKSPPSTQRTSPTKKDTPMIQYHQLHTTDEKLMFKDTGMSKKHQPENVELPLYLPLQQNQQQEDSRSQTNSTSSATHSKRFVFLITTV